MKKIWVDQIKEQCDLNGTAFFFKQWGKRQFNVDENDPTINTKHPNHAKGGCQLDGEIFCEMPINQLATA